MKVVKNYIRKAPGEEGGAEEVQKSLGTQRCPNCKQLIEKAEWRKHFKVCVMDSKYKEEKQKRDEREANKAYAGADDITQNLRRFASKRPDIFGK